MKQFVRILLWMFLLSILLVGCNSDESSTRDISPLTDSPLVSTIPTTTPEPRLVRGPDFRIEQPVAGDTVVIGTGPANIKINIVDVSWGGAVIGAGTINPDGTFTIDVTPIEGGNRVGVMLADLNDSGYTNEDFRNNENYQDLPMVGLLVYYVDVLTK